MFKTDRHGNLIKDKHGTVLGERFNQTCLFDFRNAAEHAVKLGQILCNWNAVEILPLSFWRTKDDASDLPSQVLENRKAIDVKKFREPAISELQDLNRGLATLGLGQLKIEDFIEK